MKIYCLAQIKFVKKAKYYYQAYKNIKIKNWISTGWYENFFLNFYKFNLIHFPPGCCGFLAFFHLKLKNMTTEPDIIRG